MPDMADTADMAEAQVVKGAEENREWTSKEARPIPRHPLGVKPLGNQFLSRGGLNARASLGTFYGLPDELLMTFLEYLDGRALRRVGYTCKFLFAFCASEELWKALFLE